MSKGIQKKVVWVFSIIYVTLTPEGQRIKHLTFYQGDAKKLDFIPDGSFDLVFFPMNGIDLAESINNRERILIEMSKQCRENGLLAFTSHVSTACIFSPKVRIKEKRLNFFSDFSYSQEPVVGGGIIQRQN
jgi:ubiquinone/menaquinone biosynthesis C-methylase UbiE